VRLKKFEQISPKICRAGGIPPPSARRTCPPLAEKRLFWIGRFLAFVFSFGRAGKFFFGGKFFFNA